jgi:rhodanese-related sulfurtransferase
MAACPHRARRVFYEVFTMATTSTLRRLLQPAVLAVALAAPMIAGPLGCEGIKTSDQDVQLLKESEMEAAISDPASTIVDVRKPDKFAKGHLPNAVNIYLPDIKASDPRLAATKRIIVYANGWTDPLGTAAVKRMLALGYQNVWEYKGGFELWKESGHQVITSTAGSDGRPETGDKPKEPVKNYK